MADSDSENEGVLQNVQRLVLRPPGHTGKAKRGHLSFDASKETMNLGKVDFVSILEYDLYIRPDTANPKHRFWFHFVVENAQREQRVLFHIVNLSLTKSLFIIGMTPLVKSCSKPRWQRIPGQHCFYHKSPSHSNRYVLSFAFCFDKEDDKYHFAMAQPYSLSRFNLYLDKILNNQGQRAEEILKIDVIGYSLQKRPLHLITIGNESHESDFRPKGIRVEGVKPDNNKNNEENEDNDDNEGNAKKRKPLVVIMGRSEAGASCTSFVLQGFIDFLVSNHVVARELRHYVMFKVAPMLNPDGVFVGNSQTNICGQVLNRQWSKSNNKLVPTLQAMKKLILEEEKDKIDMILDVHGHKSLTGVFVYGNAYDDVYRFERHMVFPKILAQNCPQDFSLENCLYNRNVEKVDCARRFFDHKLGHNDVNVYSLHISMLGYRTASTEEETSSSLSSSSTTTTLLAASQTSTSSSKLILYSDELYCRIGRNLARAFWDYYKIMGLIPLAEGDDGSNVRSFNLLRLKEIAQQRNKTQNEVEGLDHENDEDSKSEVRGRKLTMGSMMTPKKSSVLKPVETTIYLAKEFNNEEEEEDEDDTWSWTELSNNNRELKPLIRPAPAVYLMRPASRMDKLRNADKTSKEENLGKEEKLSKEEKLYTLVKETRSLSDMRIVGKEEERSDDESEEETRMVIRERSRKVGGGGQVSRHTWRPSSGITRSENKKLSSLSNESLTSSIRAVGKTQY